MKFDWRPLTLTLSPPGLYRLAGCSILLAFLLMPLIVGMLSLHEIDSTLYHTVFSTRLLQSLALALVIGVVTVAIAIIMVIAGHFCGSWERYFLGINIVWALLPEYTRALSWSLVFRQHAEIDQLFTHTEIPWPTLDKGLFLTALVLMFHLLPYAILLIYVNKRQVVNDWNFAQTTMSLRPFLMSIARPVIAPYCLFVCLIVVALAFSNYTIPDLFQVRTYASEIFADIAAYQHSQLALLKALISAGCILLLFTLLLRHLGRNITILISPSPRQSKTVANKFILLLASIAYAFFIGLPILALVLKGGSLDIFLPLLQSVLQSLHSHLSVTIAGAAITLMLSYSFVHAFLLQADNKAFNSWAFLLLVWTIPGTLIAISNLSLWNNNITGAILSDTSALYIMTYACCWLPVFSYLLYPKVLPHSSRHFSMAISSGMPPWSAEWLLNFKSRWRLWFILFMIAWVLMNNDSALSLLLAPPGYDNVMMKVYSFVHYGPEEMIASINLAYCMIITALLGLTATLTFFPYRFRNNPHAEH